MPAGHRRLVVALLICLVMGAAIPVSLGAEGDELGVDAVVYAVELQPDGDATWRVQYRYRLTGENESLAFQRLRERIETNATRYTDRFRDRLRPTLAAAANETGRMMSMADLGVSTGHQGLPQPNGTLGTVTYTFEWRAFAVTNASHLRAGDAIRGFYLAPETTLLVTWPTSYELARQPIPSADEVGSRRALWVGKTVFASDEPRLLLEEGSDPDTGANGGDGNGAPPDEDNPETDPSAPLLVAGLLAVLVIAGLGLYVLRGGLPGRDGLRGGKKEKSGVAADASPAADARTGGDGDASDVPPDLMSPAERVLTALEARGGRMRQQELVEETGWTESKTSKVVTELREDGTIDAFRLGRENIISLPEEDDNVD